MIEVESMNERFRTIVGGRSTTHKNPGNYPRGIEVLLKKAKVDPEFRGLFLQDPVAAAKSIDLTLTENEKKILASASGQVLQAMIYNTFVPKHHVRTFMTRTVPAMLILVIASTIILTAGGTKGISGEEMVEYWAEEALDKMSVIQNALEEYRRDCGSYPSTEQWLTGENPLKEYTAATYIYDPWKREFHYQAVKEQGRIVSYKLESLGSDAWSSNDNIPCPIDALEHRFPEDKPLSIRHPGDLPLKIDSTDKVVKPYYFIAEHADPKEAVEWYIDGTRVGSTIKTHKLLVDLTGLSLGKHFLLLVDDSGHNASMYFKVTP